MIEVLDEDVFEDTDVGVAYQSRVANRAIDFDLSQIEAYYSTDALTKKEAAPADASSLLARASALLSPTSATSSFTSLGGAVSHSTDTPRLLNEESMKRVVEKSDFLEMEVIGQFNSDSSSQGETRIFS